MDNHRLGEYIAKAISKGSRYYHATYSTEPRLYLRMVGDRKSAFLKHGIIIEKYYDVFWMNSRVFIFMPEIEHYIRKLSRTDKDFAVRAHNFELLPDDIERMFFFTSQGKIKLRMKGRKIFEYEDIKK